MRAFAGPMSSTSTTVSPVLPSVVSAHSTNQSSFTCRRCRRVLRPARLVPWHAHRDRGDLYQRQGRGHVATLVPFPYQPKLTTPPSPLAGYPTVPGIYTPAQIDAWKKIVDAIHAKGSFVFLQLWALGRAADAKCLEKDGFEVVSASDVPFEGGAKPRPLTEEEIKEYVRDYAAAAKAFVEGAGGDGVESELRHRRQIRSKEIDR